jgi:hypothetical protein
MTVNAKDVGALGNGIADDTMALQAAINQAYLNDEYLYIPSGNYLVSSSLIMPFDSSGTFNKGNYIVGDGMMRTNIEVTAPNTILFKYSQPSPLKFMLGGEISGMTLSGNNQSGSVGIQAQALFSQRYSNMQVTGFTNGFNIVNTGNPGDNDACNHLIIENSRIENCSQWGIFSTLATGNNETSFISIRDTTIESCGTSAGAIGGGMYWRGQVLQFDNSAFVVNKNRGLYIEGGAGLGSNVLANSLCFENNQGMSLQCYGITGMEFNNLQIYNNDANVAQYGIYLNAQSSYIGQVRVNSAKIRATAGNNPYVAFLAAGANVAAGTIVADGKQIRWDNWGYAGQTQFSGFTVV